MSVRDNIKKLKVLFFFKLIEVEKPAMRETECQNPHKKNQNSYQVMKVSKFNQMKIWERLI